MKKWVIALCLIGMVSGCAKLKEDDTSKEPELTLETTTEPEVIVEPETMPEAEVIAEAEPTPEPEVIAEAEPTPELEVVEEPETTQSTSIPESIPEKPTPSYVAPVITSRYYDMELTEQENVALALQKAGVSGNATVVKAVDDPNIVVVLKAMSPIERISIHDLNQDKFGEAGYDIYTYMQAHTDSPIAGTLTHELGEGNVIAFLCVEPDTIPWHYLSWATTSGATGAYVVQFNGKGN